MSVAEKVREYLKNKPYILEALEKDIVNLSSLSRIIGKELKIDSLAAIKAAVRRFSEELRKVKRKREEKVLQILKESNIALRDGMNVIISKRPLKVKSKFIVSLNDKNVYVVDKLEEISENDILSLHKNCGIVVINSPPEIEETPGVVAYLTSILAENNINVIEFISCYTYTILVVDRKDILRTYETLSKIIGRI
jgi:aspartokinase